MTLLHRRNFLRLAGVACISAAAGPAVGQSSPHAPEPAALPIRLGVVSWVRDMSSLEGVVHGIREMGFSNCQIGFANLTIGVAASLKHAMAEYQIEATALSEHGPGIRVFDFYRGPETVGIIPPSTRQARIRNLKLASDVASLCGIPAIHTHCGFIPENPNDPLYSQAVGAVKDVASYCKERDQMFLCEMGQETPITLLRLIEDVGLDNVFVNLDTANLLLYNKGNPVDAMDILGDRVRGIHAKDGVLPTNTKTLGEEVAMGRGKVDFLRVLQKLRQVNYSGAMTIESEMPGESVLQQKASVLQSKAFLENLLAKTCS